MRGHSTIVAWWASARGVAVVFGVALVGVLYFAPKAASSYDGTVMAQVAVSMATHGTPLVHPFDPYGLNTPYSGYGLGTSVFMAAFYKVGAIVGSDPNRALALTNSFLFAATVAAVFVLLRRRRFTPSTVVVTTLLFAIGTPLLAYAASDFSEPGVALMVALALIGLDGSEGSRPLAPLGVGASIGAAVLIRSDSVLLVALPVLVALWWLSARRWRPVALAVGTASPFIAVWLAYNQARFDSPLSSGYKLQTFSHPLLKGLYGLALSPGRGLFIYVPLLILALAVLPFQRGGNLVLGVLALAMLALRMGFYARWYSWFGGDSWGPRFMVPILPAFAPLVAEGIWRWRRNPLVYLAATASVAMSVIGLLVVTNHLPLTYREPQADPIQDAIPIAQGPDGVAERLMRRMTSSAFVNATDDTMFDWSRFPARHKPEPPQAPQEK
jgi:hypothetical protein